MVFLGNLLIVGGYDFDYDTGYYHHLDDVEFAHLSESESSSFLCPVNPVPPFPAQVHHHQITVLGEGDSQTPVVCGGDLASLPYTMRSCYLLIKGRWVEGANFYHRVHEEVK